MKHENTILYRSNQIQEKNRKKSAYETVRDLIRHKVNIAKQNHSINELNDCNNQIINLLDKNKINQNECVKLINDVYKYAPIFKPNNENKLKDSLKKAGYHFALKILNRNHNKVFRGMGNFAQAAKYYIQKFLTYLK